MTMREEAMGQREALTEREITRRVFAGASVSEPRGLSDVFSTAELAAIASSPDAGFWRWHAVSVLDAMDRGAL
jgi:hypothetical protein